MELNYPLSCFGEYLQSRGIKIHDEYAYVSNKDLSTERILQQIRLLNKFHQESSGFNESKESHLDSLIGKTTEKYQVDLKKLKRIIKNIKKEKPKNRLEEILLLNEELYVNGAEGALSCTQGEKYINLIKRSMTRGEICLGNPYFNNLREENNIIVSNINKCCYDMVEMDAIILFRKLRAKGYAYELKCLIELFCREEALDAYSYEYISSLMKYPYYFIKWSLRYNEAKRNWSSNDYLNKIINSQEMDGYKMRL